MIRITREADYGILLMTCLIQADGQPRSAAALAQQRQLPLPMVSKILKALARAGLLVSQRGAQGGYGLARAPADISAADIIGALEGPIAITECSEEGHDGCSRLDHCEVSGHWPRINQAIYAALQSISLLEMSRPDPPQPVRFALHRVAAANAASHLL
ncbi:MAG TPA: SUF system Fe-S cluster assembly regulator [Candidatus Competibacter sp.]|nr:SUF system Fe-S cluster assembly regulator [Candidatus Competibacter sp.]